MQTRGTPEFKELGKATVFDPTTAELIKTTGATNYGELAAATKKLISRTLAAFYRTDNGVMDYSPGIMDCYIGKRNGRNVIAIIDETTSMVLAEYRIRADGRLERLAKEVKMAEPISAPSPATEADNFSAVIGDDEMNDLLSELEGFTNPRNMWGADIARHESKAVA